MNGWEFLIGALWCLVWAWCALVVGFSVLMIVDAFRQRNLHRYHAAIAWKEGYDAGVNDERKAAEWDIPEYRIPARQNPYGDPAKYRGGPHANQSLQAPR